MRRTAQLVDRLGYDHLWTFDHLLPNIGDHEAAVHEDASATATWAEATTHPRLGLMVSADAFRDPALVAKMAITLDHAVAAAPCSPLARRGSSWSIEHWLDFGSGFREHGTWLAGALDHHAAAAP